MIDHVDSGGNDVHAHDDGARRSASTLVGPYDPAHEGARGEWLVSG